LVKKATLAFTPTADDVDQVGALFEADGDVDVLTGGTGADWFILGTGDRITDLAWALRCCGGTTGDQVTYL
jgi:hypothetical protein